MRLGDLDVLKAQLKKLPMMSNWGEAFIPRLIDEQPTIDAVPVVRCKDCIHLGFCGEATNLEVMGFYGFCSRGQRKVETVLPINDAKNESLEADHEI